MERARSTRKGTGASRLALVMALAVLVVLTTGAAVSAEPGGAGAACRRGGWRQLVDVNGRGFKNQGQCVRAAVHGRLGQDPNLQVTGPFVGTTTIDFVSCAFVDQVFEASFTNASGSGSFHTEGCVDLPDIAPLFPYSGSFTLTAPNGGSLTGTVSGTIDVTPDDRLLDFTFTVETATGALSGVSGSIHLVGVWIFEIPTGPISGTLTGQLVRS